MAVVGDRAGALNALATGGSAGLEAYQKAQQQNQDYQRQAIDNVLGGQGTVKIPSGAAADVANVVKSRTSGYANDAQSGLNLATEQIGYDSTALDVFLRKQQERLDMQRREAEQNMELSSLSHQGKVAGWQRQLSQSQASQGDGSVAAWFSQLDQETRDALVKGTAQAAQQQDLQTAQAASQQYDDAQGDLTSAKIRARHAEEHPESVKPQQGLQSFYTPEGQANQAEFTQNGLQQLVANMQAQWEGNKDKYLEARQAIPEIQLNLPRFEQEVATDFYGMDPFMAAGLYPADEEALAERRKILDEWNSYIPGAAETDAQVAYNNDQDALYRDKFEQEGLSWDGIKAGSQSASMSPTTAAAYTQRKEFADAGAAADDWRARTDLTAEQRLAEFESEIRAVYEDDPTFANFIIGYFRTPILYGNRDIYSVTDPAASGG